MEMTLKVTINGFNYESKSEYSNTACKLDEFVYDASYKCKESETKEMIDALPGIFAGLIDSIKAQAQVSFDIPSVETKTEEPKKEEEKKEETKQKDQDFKEVDDSSISDLMSAALLFNESITSDPEAFKAARDLMNTKFDEEYKKLFKDNKNNKK